MIVLQVTEDSLEDIISSLVIKGEEVNSQSIFEMGQELGYSTTIADEDEDKMFAKIYLMYRRRLHHKGLILITPMQHQAWRLIQAISKEVANFAKENSLSYRDACIEFLDIAQLVTNSLKLSELVSKLDKIHYYKLCEHIIDSDSNKELTKELYEEYKVQYLKRTGKLLELEATVYVNFVEAAKLARQYRWGPKQYIKCFIEAYEWTGTMVSPYQLQGNTAVKVLNGEQDKTQPEVKKVKVDLKKIFKDRSDD